MFAGRNRLPDLRIQVSYLSVNRSFHFQVFQTLTNQCQAPFHITYILVKTAYLTFPKNMILPDTFVNNSQLLFGCYIFFLCLAIVFTCYQLFVYQTFILLITALLPDKLFIQADTFLFQLQSFLLHTNPGITQLVFLISKIGFTLHDTDIEQWVAKTQNHITGLYHSSLFFQALIHTTAFYGIHIDNPARHDLTNHTDIITELGLLDSSNCQPVFLHCHRRSCISENKIGNHSKSEHYPTDPIKTFAIDAGFSFNKCIHNGL